MNKAWYSFAGTIILYGTTTLHLDAREVACHIHAPEDYPQFSSQPLVMPAVGNRMACEKVNLLRFSSRGRCHCTQDPMDMEKTLPLDYSPQSVPEGRLP
ncbi:MAG: hypothetical protein AB2552_11425 [Candidatus Thiodiazotropha endolucinida]